MDGRRRPDDRRDDNRMCFARLEPEEIRKAFEPINDKYPPILSKEQAAELAGYRPSTLVRKVSEGLFDDCVSRRRPLRFWRDRFIKKVMK